MHGYDGLPPLTGSRYLTAWDADPLVIAGLVLTAALYCWAAARLRRRGDHWSAGRDVAFLAGGLGTVAFATLWWPAAYDGTLFWAHMVQHMALSMVAPIFLALGAPVTLLLRTLPAGGRRRLTAVLRSLPAKAVINPITGFGLLFGTPFVLYYTGLYEASLEHTWLHVLLHVHFLAVGCVFYWPLVGVDPVPGQLAYPLRLLVLAVSLPAHAFLGISIMSDNEVLAGGYYRALARPWGPSLLHDQAIGGGLLWTAGDFVGLIVVAALVAQWVKADRREAIRIDRRLDRAERINAQRQAAGVDGGTDQPPEDEFTAYNARLAQLAAQSTNDHGALDRRARRGARKAP
jgi:putative membrane protein